MTLGERVEFDRVLSLIAEKAGTDRGRERLLGLSVTSDRNVLIQRYALIREGMNKENPPVYVEKDLSSIITALKEGQILSPEELLELGSLFDFLRRLFRSFQKDTHPGLYHLISQIVPLTSVREKIAKLITEDGEVVTEKIERLEQELKNLRTRIKKRLGDQLTLRDRRYVIPILAGVKIDGIVHDVSRGGKTLFVEPTDCISFNNEIEIIRRLIQEEKKRVLSHLSLLLRERLPDIDNNLDILSKYDEIITISNTAKRNLWEIPRLGGELLRIVRGRHPLLSGDVVPLDMEIGRELKTLLITGPNMGGKTVALKTVGLLSLMALSGIPVPVLEGSTFPLFDRIFMDIGDESSIETGESTFSFHLKELKKILTHSTKNSLILIDEIDRGTEPEGGRALSQAFLEEFTERGGITIATSHSTALKFFVREKDGMENGRMETKESIPTYRLKIGFPGESLWFETARSIGIDKKVLKMAEKYTDRDTLRVDYLLRELSSEREKLSSLGKEMKEERELLSNRLKDAEDSKKRWQEQLKRIKKEKRAIFLSARRKVENLVREIRESSARRESIVKAKREIELEIEDVEEKRVSDLEIGDRVASAPLPPQIVKPQKELNIRGYRIDEAISVLERYIDDVWVFGDEGFKIIHGIGKGVLKDAVWQFLSNDKRVESFALAPLNEGGDGVTVGRVCALL